MTTLTALRRGRHRARRRPLFRLALRRYALVEHIGDGARIIGWHWTIRGAQTAQLRYAPLTGVIRTRDYVNQSGLR